jgi:hypothetical protein
MQPKNREECQFLYKRLIRVLDNPINTDSASYYIRNLNNTISCDQFSNLKTLRYEMFNAENINKLNNRYHSTNIKLEFHRIYLKLVYNKK